MSRIYFHTLETDLELRGSERAYMGYIINQLAIAFLSPEINEERIKKLVAQDSYVLNYTGKEFVDTFSTWFKVSYNKEIGGCDTFSLALNTAYKFGNDQIKLMCRLHGQSEIHCWILPEHAHWLAGIIKVGLDIGLYRHDAGWEELMKFCETYNDNKLIVCSYSVCDQFPNSYAAVYDKRRNWDNLSGDEQWDAGEKFLVKNKGLQISPDNWDTFYYNDGKTVLDILKEEV